MPDPCSKSASFWSIFPGFSILEKSVKNWLAFEQGSGINQAKFRSEFGLILPGFAGKTWPKFQDPGKSRILGIGQDWTACVKPAPVFGPIWIGQISTPFRPIRCNDFEIA